MLEHPKRKKNKEKPGRKLLVVNIYHFKKHYATRLPTTHTHVPSPRRQYGYLHGSFWHVGVLLLLSTAHARGWFVVGHLAPVALTVCVGALHVPFLLFFVHSPPEVGALPGELGKLHFLALLAVHRSPFLHEECVRAHSPLGLVWILVLLGRHCRYTVVGEFVGSEKEALHLARDREERSKFEF